MTGFFYVLGWAITLGGIGWAFLVAMQPVEAGSILVAAKLLALIPCFAVAGSGLLFVAVAAVLHRLDRLIEDR